MAVVGAGEEVEGTSVVAEELQPTVKDNSHIRPDIPKVVNKSRLQRCRLLMDQSDLRRHLVSVRFV